MTAVYSANSSERSPKRWSRQLRVGAGVAALGLIFGLLPAVAANAAGPAVVSVVTSITDTAGNPLPTVDASATTNYQLNVAYSCNIADCTGTKVTIPASALDPFYNTYRRETNSYVYNPPFTPAPPISGTPNTGLTVDLGTVPAGTSASFSIVFTVRDVPLGGVAGGSFFLNGSQISRSATITATDSDNPATSTATATWVNTVPNPTAAVGGNAATATDTDYNVSIGNSTSGCVTFDASFQQYRGASWLTCAASYTASVKLPPNAIYVAGSGGTYDAATSTVTFSGSGITAARGILGSPSTFAVRFPSTAYPTTGAGCSATESFTGSHTVTYLDGQVKTANAATFTVNVGNCEAFAKGNMSKRFVRANAGTTVNPIPSTPGQVETDQYWDVTVNNQANVPGVGRIIDTTLDQPDLPVRQARVVTAGPATVTYTLDDGTTGTVTVANNGSYFAPAGRHITAIDATSSPLAGANTTPGGTAGTPFRMIFYTSLAYGATPRVLTNTATGSVSYPSSPQLSTVDTGPVSSTITLTVAGGGGGNTLSLAATAPVASTVGGSTPVVGSQVNWRTGGVVGNQQAGSAYRPQYVFIAPQFWTITPGSAVFVANAPAGATFDYRTVTYNGTTRDAVVVTWASPTGTVGNSALPQIDVKAVPTILAPAGTNNQTATMLLGDADNGSAVSYSAAKYTDTTDIDGDGSTTDAFAATNGVTSLAATRSVGVTKEICRPSASAPGGCDWISDPNIRVGVPPFASSIKYRVTVQNLGNAALSNINIYDVLPYIGDVGTTDATAGTPRGSTVQETLASVSDVGAGVTLAYSTSNNPPRPEVYSGATTGTWTTTVAGASSIRATLTSLPFQGSRSFVYDAALVNGAADQVACNSVAAAADLLAPIEPRPVCATTEESDLTISAGAHYPLQTNRPGVIPFTVTNLGGSTQAPATATVAVPAGVGISNLTVPGWTCTAPVTTGPTTISCRPVQADGTTARLLALNAPETLGLGFTPTGSAASTVCFTGTAIGIYYDPNPANDSAGSCATVAPSPPELRVTKTDGVGSVAVGQQTTYTISASNLLVGESLGTVTITDTLPPGVAYVSSTPAAVVNGSTVTWTIPSLGPVGTIGDGTGVTGGAGSSAGVALTVQVLPGTQNTIANSVTMTAADPAAAAQTLSSSATDTDTVVNVFTALNPAVTTPQNTPVTTPLADIVTSTGAPLDPTAVTAQTAPQHGSLAVDPVTGAVTYTPTAGYSGPDTYQIRFCDTSAPAQCGFAPVSITVQANSVTAVPDSATTTVQTPVTTNVRANDTSASGQPLANPTVLAQPANGTATVTGAGNITYTPAAGFSGADAYGYQVCDTSAPTPVCASSTVNVLVHNVFVDGPAADANGGTNTAQNTPVTTPLSDIVTTTGAPLDPATVTVVVAPLHGTLSIDPVTGAATYTPGTGYGGTDVYEVNVCDTAVPQECHSVVVGVTIPPNVVDAGNDTAATDAGQPVTTDVLANDTSQSAQPLGTPTIAIPPTNGAAAVEANGSITYTPAAGYSGTDSYIYEICDTSIPTPSCDTAIVAVTIDNVFVDGPAAAGITTPQNTPVTTPLADIVSTAGMPLDPTAVTQQTAPQHGSISINPTTGAVTYAPATGYAGADSYAVTVCDTATPQQCDTTTIPVTVQGNTVLAAPDSATTSVQMPVTSDVRANDTSSSGQPLADPTVIVQPSNGTATVTASGDITYLPAGGFSGADSYTYQVCDTSTPTPACDTAAVSVIVHNVFFDGPAAQANGGITTTQNTAVVTPLSDIMATSGAALDPASVTLVTAPQNGTVAVDAATGAVTYTPDAGYAGADSYEVSACDTATPQECHSVVVGVSVSANVVVAGDDTATTTAGQPVTSDVLANDTSGSGQPFGAPNVLTPPAHGTAVVQPSGSITYTPAAGYSGTDSYVYEICDTSNPTPVCDSATVAVTINNVFVDGPAAAGITTPQNTPVTTPLADIVTTVGMPLDPTTVTAQTAPQHGTLAIDPVTGAVRYTPATGYSGADSYTIRVCDTASPQQCDTTTVPVSVQSNTVVAAPDSATTIVQTPVTTDVRANDTSASGEPLANPTVASPPAHGTATVTASGDITYLPAAGFSGADSYTYQVCDTSVPTPACSTAAVSVIVHNVFVDGPAADANGGTTTTQNTPVVTPLSDIVTTTGAPLDPTTVTVVVAPRHGTVTVDPVTGAVTYTPGTGYGGTDSFTVNVCDTSAPQECHSVVVGVTIPPNEVLAGDDTASTTAGQPVTTDVLANDTSKTAQALGTPTIAIPPTHGTAVVEANGSITYTPAAGYSGTDSYVYEICDTSVPVPSCDSATVAVTIDNVFVDGPAAAGITTPQNTPVTTPLGDIATTLGMPLDPTAVTQQTAPQHGSLTIDPATGAVTYTPTAGYSGADSYAVTVCDTATPQQCDTVTIPVTVGANVVTATDDTATTSAEQAVTTDVRANDTSASGQPLGLPTVTAQGAHGTAAPNADGTITYTPDAAFSGPDSYTYQVCDTSTPTPVCDDAVVDVTVDNVFVDGPAAQGNVGVETPQNTAVTTPLADIVTTLGLPIDPSAVSVVVPPNNGTIAIDQATGAVTYTPAAGYSGVDTYAVSACDTGTPPTCHTVTVEVSVLANTVSAPDLALTTRTNETADPLDVMAVSVSASGQPLATPPTIAAPPLHGTVTVNPDNTLTYAPDTNFSGSDSFSYRVCDTSLPTPACDTGVVAVTVDPVADIAVAKSLDVPLIVASLPIVYTIATTNNGPSAAADVRTVDPIPSAILNPRGTPDAAISGASCLTRPTQAADLAALDPAYGPYTLASYPNVVECTYASIPSGTTVQDTITGTVDPALVAGTLVANQVVVFAASYDPVLSNNTAGVSARSVVLPPVIAELLPGLAATGSTLQALPLIGLITGLVIVLGALLIAVGQRRRRNREG